VRRERGRTICALALAGVAVAACRSDRPAAAPSVVTGAVAADSSRPKAAAHRVREVSGLSHPESARYDPELDLWFVSNINGDPLAKDNNGFITRLEGNGTVDVLKFVAGGRNGVRLNAPKGIAIVGDTVWVADIDVVRGFNRRTGAQVASVSLAGRAKFLNDIAAGPDGIYITDTGIEAGKGGGSKHTGPDRIFRIDPSRKASIALESDSLQGPNGITWDSAGRRFVIVPFFGSTPLAWAPGDAAPRVIGSGPGQEDGVELVAPGRLLVTSWADSSLFALEQGRATRVAGPLPSPADIGWDPGRHRVAVPLLLEDRLEFWEVP
jgi:sugar lactone lactonase YvrE